MSFSENKLTVRSSADLAAAVPYLLGFHPSDGSVVVLACRDRRVVFVARGDLPAAATGEHHLRGLGDHLVTVLQRQQPITDLVIVGYGTPEHVDPAVRVLDDVFTAAGMQVRAALRVAEGRVYSVTCDEPGCCPPQGTPFDPTTSPLAVQATVAGLVAFTDRAAVASRFAPVGGAARDTIRHASSTAATRLTALRAEGGTAVHAAGVQAVRDALRRHDAGERLTDDEVAWLTVLLARRPIRDVAVDLTEARDEHVTFWADVTRRAHEPLVPAPAILLAIAAWRCGDGALAGMAAEHALRIDPHYQLADLVLQALRVGLPPTGIEQAITSPATRTSHNPFEKE
ncbi:DUF4192 domain-containing protein [Micromonospora sp. NPDC050686]|uniref:DUF4192 domain-containing protein n=1 Tax=Micromonospora sp. NPDC050686 TaxID=3154631 RepID=UPI003408D4C1